MKTTSHTDTLLDTPTAAELQRFCIEDREHMLRILHGLIREGGQISAFFKNGAQQQQLPTRLLDVDPENEQLYLDISQDEKANQAILAADRVQFIGKYQQVKYRFAAPTPRLSRLFGEPVFTTEMPNALFWLQRRNFFRIKPAQHKPLVGMGITPAGETTQFIVRDISIGGIGLVEPTDRMRRHLDSGDILKNCHITLPNSLELECDMEVKNRWEYTSPKGTKSHHVGTEFLNMPSRIRMQLQRYIFRQEISRHQHQMLN